MPKIQLYGDEKTVLVLQKMAKKYGYRSGSAFVRGLCDRFEKGELWIEFGALNDVRYCEAATIHAKKGLIAMVIGSLRTYCANNKCSPDVVMSYSAPVDWHEEKDEEVMRLSERRRKEKR